MKGGIVRFLREYVLGLSIITTIIGFILLLIGILWFWFRDFIENNSMIFIEEIGDWSVYLLITGFVVFGIGFYYLYSYIKNRNFVLKELKTNKRSELLKMHKELKIKAKHLPSKYQKMLAEKEEEFNI